MKTYTNDVRRGFTIVELLIVIVVIGILAVITIVAYNGIQKRAQTTAYATGASQIQKQILVAVTGGEGATLFAPTGNSATKICIGQIEDFPKTSELEEGECYRRTYSDGYTGHSYHIDPVLSSRLSQYGIKPGKLPLVKSDSGGGDMEISRGYWGIVSFHTPQTPLISLEWQAPDQTSCGVGEDVMADAREMMLDYLREAYGTDPEIRSIIDGYTNGAGWVAYEALVRSSPSTCVLSFVK